MYTLKIYKKSGTSSLQIKLPLLRLWHSNTGRLPGSQLVARDVAAVSKHIGAALVLAAQINLVVSHLRQGAVSAEWARTRERVAEGLAVGDAQVALQAGVAVAALRLCGMEKFIKV